MAVRFLNPDSLTKPVGYSHGAAGTGEAILLAGQIGCDASGAIVAPGDIVAQFALALDNMLSVLLEAGGGPDDLAHLRIFVTDVPAYRENLKGLGAAWKERFGRRFPAMTLAGVTELFDADAMVEIDGIAYVG